jgi:hypothetical protein
MLRVILLLLVNFITFSSLVGQVKKYYTLENNQNFDKVNIVLTATSNSCCIKPTVNPHLVNVFGYDNNANPNIYSETEILDRIQNLIIDLNNNDNDEEPSIAKSFFSPSTESENHWDLYLSNEKTMRLSLNYAVGDAKVDLSDLPIERLDISSGSAEVNVEYMENKSNLVEMDSFLVKVDLGSLTINKMNHSRARTVIADVGFGALLVDYSGPLSEPSDVYASVGAGNLIIGLPDDEKFPVIINIQNSPLCNVKIPKGYKKQEKHVYVSQGYHENASNILSFNLDVVVGQIKFVEYK